MKRASIFFALCLTAICGMAQTWTEVATFNSVIYDLQLNNNKLYVGGDFTSVFGQGDSYHSAEVSGNSLTRHTTDAGGGVDKFDVLDNTLYAAGNFTTNGVTGVATWDGNEWVSIAGVGTSGYDIYSDGDTIYYSDDFGGIFRSSDGISFDTLPTVGFNGHRFFKYNNQLLLSKAQDSLGTHFLMKLVNDHWEVFSDGLTGTVIDMGMYNGELHVVGSFDAPGGGVKDIAKWNGTSWLPVGGSVTSGGGAGIRDLMVLNNELYVVGAFNEIGGISVSTVVKWDGSTWTDMEFEGKGNFADAIEAYNGNIYVGTFDFDTAGLYKFPVASVGIEETVSELDATVYPNPTSGELFIDIAGETTETIQMRVQNITGQTVMEIADISESRSVDVSALAPGIYFYQIRSGEETAKGKVIKQ